MRNLPIGDTRRDQREECIQVAGQTIYTQDANVSARAANPRSFPRASITAPGTLPSLRHQIRSFQNPRLQIAFIDVEEYLRKVL